MAMKINTKRISWLIPFALFIVSCVDKPQSMETATDSNTQAGVTIKLTKAQTEVANIELGALEEREVFQKVQTNGYFDVPPQNKAQVSTIKSGFIKNTTLLVGDQVKKGQQLVVLENLEFVKVQQKFMEIKGQLDYLKFEFERKKILEQENITAKRNLQKAEADYKTALAQYQGLKKELELMGINPASVTTGNYVSTMIIRSPIEGTITKVNATIGKYIPPEEVLFEIVNTDHLHVELRIFEKDILKIKKGQKIELRIPSMNQEVYNGEIYLVGKALDQDTRTVNVHGHVEEEEEFLPGMYVEASILMGQRVVQVLPAEAVISENEGQSVFIKVSEEQNTGYYRKVGIKTGTESEGWVEIVPNDSIDGTHSIVVKGAYFLTSTFDK
jgi:cobalt-zinc-cadmium efflux system membrane fusion protein